TASRRNAAGVAIAYRTAANSASTASSFATCPRVAPGSRLIVGAGRTGASPGSDSGAAGNSPARSPAVAGDTAASASGGSGTTCQTPRSTTPARHSATGQAPRTRRSMTSTAAHRTRTAAIPANSTNTETGWTAANAHG